MDDILQTPVSEVIQKNYYKVFPAERKVIDVVKEKPQEVVNMNISELAKASGVSDATVVRMCNHIGYKGYYQFRIALAQEVGRNQSQDKKEEQKNNNGISELFQKYAQNMIAIGENMELEMVMECAHLMNNSNQVHILAVGNTSQLAQYMGFRLGRIGIRCTFTTGPEYFMNHVNLADPEDVIIAISRSGSSKAVVQGIELGREKKLKTIAITAHRHSPIAEMADYSLISCGEKEDFDYFKNNALLSEMAVIDAILSILMKLKGTIGGAPNLPEFILADTKL